jgi:hypothetical protein
VQFNPRPVSPPASEPTDDEQRGSEVTDLNAKDRNRRAAE